MYELARTYDLFEPLQKPIADGVGINVDDIPEPHRLAERGW